MKQSLFKDSLISRLGRNEMTFESFLTDAEVFLSIKRNNKIVTSFALDYVDKLLDYAIFGTEDDCKKQDLSNRAMKIITVNNSKLIYAISDGTKLTSLARKILNKHEDFIENSKSEVDKKWNCVIGKFSTILETCFNKYPENISNFRFLLNFLPFCENIMISSFFKLIVVSKKEEVKSYLRLIKFQDEVIDIITKWHNGEDSGISTECILSIYSIFIKYVSNIVNDGCLSPGLVQFALEFLPTNDRKIIAKQWKLANEVIDTTNSNDFATLYLHALRAARGNIDIDINSDLEKEISYFPSNFPIFYKYQENALKFLSSLFSCFPSFASEIDGKQLIQALAYIYEKFPFSSFALSGVCTLMLILIEIGDIQNLVIDIFIPIIVEKFREDLNDECVDTSHNDDYSDGKIEFINSESASNPEDSDNNIDSDENDSIIIDDSVIDNDENDSIIIEEDIENSNKNEIDEIINIKNNDSRRTMSVNQRAFTLEFARQVIEMCMSNDELKEQVGLHQDFLEIFIPKVAKATSFLSNDYGGMCFMPNMVRYTNMDTLKPMDLSVSVNI